MPGQLLPPELTAKLLEQGMGPVAVARYLKDHRGIDVTPAAVSMFRKRHTDIAPMQSGTKRRVVPWPIRKEHEGSAMRHAILAYWQRENDHPLADERWRNLFSTEARLKEAGEVINYSPNLGFHTVPARPGIDLGIVREPDDKPRPATRGPYAVREELSAGA